MHHTNVQSRFLVIVAGSVAAIKAPFVIRRLCEKDHDVQVIATDRALSFVTPLALSSAAGKPVLTSLDWFESTGTALHLQLARAFDGVLIVGATANLMARAALGLASDLASAVLLSVECPVVWAPAMNTKMWLHPATVAHKKTLASWGHTFVGPVEGALGTRGEGQGLGRMVEPEVLVTYLEDRSQKREQDWAGKRFLITAGPTREYLDPVRFISNPSSGKMGFALAEAALSRGAQVDLVTGPVHISPPPQANVIRVETALEMFGAVKGLFPSADAVLMTAAVADYRAKEILGEKQPKSEGPRSIELVSNPDILEYLGVHKTSQKLIGFAMETQVGLERALAKVRRKQLDFICLNYPTQEGTGFGGDDNEITLVWPDGTSKHLPRKTKHDMAHCILDEMRVDKVERWE